MPQIQNPSNSNDIDLDEYLRELDKIAQSIPANYRSIFYYIEYSKILNKPLDPEIQKFVDDLNKLNSSDIKNMQMLNNVNKRLSGYARPVTRANVQSLLSQ